MAAQWGSGTWNSFVLYWCAHKFPDWNFAMGYDGGPDDRAMTLFVYAPQQRGCSLPGVGQEPVLALRTPEKGDLAELQVLQIKLLMVTGGA